MSETLIFNGNGAVFGRMATVVAKELLKGNNVHVINVDDIIVSGSGKQFAERIQAKRRMGKGSSLKGPKYIRQSDRLVKRMIRGMLPRDRMKGQDAFRKLMCHKGLGGFKEEEVKGAISFDHKKPMKYSTIKQVMEFL